jgi:hypothetical protein
VASTEALALHETMIGAHHGHLTDNLRETVTGHRQALAKEVRGQAKMIGNRQDLPMRRNRVSRMKECGHTEIALDSSQKDPDQDDPETGL